MKGTSLGHTTLGHDRTPSVQLKIESTGGPLSHRRWSTVVIRNMEFVASQLSIITSKSSPIVQTVSLALILCYSLQYGGDFITDTLTLSPGTFLSPGQWLWSFIATLTHPFIEYHWYNVMIDIVTLSLCGTLIEPLWGQREVISFLICINLSVAFITVINYILLYIVTSDTSYLFSTHIHGMSAFCASICVIVKQLLPQSILIATSLGKLKNDHIPLMSLLIAIVFYVLNLIEGSSVVMFVYGLIFSWIYLRYIQRHNDRRGDFSDQFAFHTFFPNVIQPMVAVLGDGIYQLVTRCGLCPKVVTQSGQYQTYRVLSERLTHEHHNQQQNTREFSQPKVEHL